MILDQYKNKTILILGYGREGKATERFLRSRYPSIHIQIADQSSDPEYLEKQYASDFVIKTPGIPKEKLNVPYTTATNIFFEFVPSKQIIGITGTKGKSTTTSLIHHILKTSGRDSRLVGNIGNPMLQELLNSYSEETMFVAELSSYQLDDTESSPHIAVFTSFFPDHLDYHQTLEMYAKAKFNIFRFQKPEDFAVFHPSLRKQQYFKEITAKIHYADLYQVPEKRTLIGKHNEDNIRLAASVSQLLAIDDEIVHKSVSSFQPLDHRLENIGAYSGIDFIDDAISTTPESTIAALEAIDNVDTVFLGGQNRGYDFSQLVDKLSEKAVSNIVLFPDSGLAVKEELNKRKDYNPHTLETDSMEEAVKFAFRYTTKGSVCLLSTASPSYSLWKNFEEKGDQFKFYVKRHANKNQEK